MANDHIKNFGFPRWGEYGRDSEAEPVKMCDYSGCSEKGSHPAPKSPGSNDRWYFCRSHAAEYNRNWNYFEGLSKEEIEREMHNSNSASSDAFASARSFEWGGVMDEHGNSSTEQKAFDVLELDVDAGMDAVKKQYRKLAKLFHPDSNPGDPQAAERFYEIQTAYEILAKKLGG